MLFCVTSKSQKPIQVSFAAHNSLEGTSGITSARVLFSSSWTLTISKPFARTPSMIVGKGTHSLLPIAAAIVQQNNVAAMLVINRTWRQMRQNIGSNVFRAAPRVVPPVVGIELVADSDVSHLLRGFERTHLIFCVRFLVDGIWRTEQNSANPQFSGKKLLREIELQAWRKAARYC